MKKTNIGILLGLGTYVLWGFLSLFWKLLSDVPAYSIFSYRIVFTVLTISIYMVLSRRTRYYKRELTQLFLHKKEFFLMALAALLIATNWLVYIYAIGSGQATAASLGYYVNPLISILLAYLVLRESLSRVTILAILVAMLGVIVLMVNTGSIPMVTLVLALTFAFYGLIKKQVALPSDIGMLIEAGLICPAALTYLIFFAPNSFWSFSLKQQVLLALSGLVTAIPLLLFAEAVKRAPLNIIGFIQYINPTLQLMIAVFIFHEKVSLGEWIGFIFIWLAIAIFVLGQRFSATLE